VASEDLTDVLFPLGELTKREVRQIAAEAGLPVSTKRDSTGICFIGERPFDEFLSRYVRPTPGRIVTETGKTIGAHRGLPFYTLGQRRGLGVGGVADRPEDAWYVAAKRAETNELVVVQGHDHPALLGNWLETAAMHWIGPPPAAIARHGVVDCHAKTRYRQADQACRLTLRPDGSAEAVFAASQRSMTPGQYAVFYEGERCLGGARIERTGWREAVNAAVAG
ncbi:MAG: aminomethyltransferase beta-barrel domain-containing protein, partial [Gammaproteobacteria bacterium]|nr:aminomethyltransferase beta-barrel domain-containing protein [Gammaproteobacteria bacterium]